MPHYLSNGSAPDLASTQPPVAHECDRPTIETQVAHQMAAETLDHSGFTGEPGVHIGGEVRVHFGNVPQEFGVDVRIRKPRIGIAVTGPQAQCRGGHGLQRRDEKTPVWSPVTPEPPEVHARHRAYQSGP